MARSLATIGKMYGPEGLREALNDRMREVEYYTRKGIPLGLGMLAAKDAQNPSGRKVGKGKTVVNKKLAARQEAYAKLKMYASGGALSGGVGKRYPEGYCMPGSNK